MKRCYIYFFICLFFALSLLIGCGGGSVDYIPVVINNNNANYVSLSGFVTEGTQNSIRTSSELRYSLGNNLSGIVVFIEDNKSLKGITDNNGKFIINKVPEGYHSLIAEKTEAGIITYRQRLNYINIKGIDNHFELPEPISIIPSPYSLNLFITDKNNKPINNAKISLWGTDYSSDNNGLIKLSSFPTLSNIETTVIASGYKSSKMILSFGESLNSKIFVKLSQFSENNIAPIVAIKHEDNSSILKENNNLYISSNRQIILSALGNDPDGNTNKITWKWSADKGSFSGLTTANTVTYTSPNNSGEVTITLVGKDEKGLEGKAELNLIVVGGSDTDTDTSTNTNTATSTSSGTSTDTETSTSTGTSTNSDTGTESQIQTNTETSTNTQTDTNTQTSTQTNTSTVSNTDTDTSINIHVDAPINTYDKISVTFSKELKTSDFANNVSFLPLATGTWKFSNDNKTATFNLEKGNWYPGSYNKLVILNDLKFNDETVLNYNFNYKFIINSDIPVPNGYRSYAFPAELDANELITAEVPELKTNKYSYAMVISKSDNSSGAVATPINNANHSKDLTYKYRLKEQELCNVSTPDILFNTEKSKLYRASSVQHNLGENRYFYVAEGGSGNDVYRSSTLVAMSDQVLIYVLNNCLNEESYNKAQNILTSVEKILDKNRDFFGEEPLCGLDLEERISIIVYESIKNQNGGEVLGYFSPDDFYYRNTSNCCKALYLAYNKDMNSILATLAHEFQHMIYFYNKRIVNNIENLDDVWLNEGLSKYAEEINGYNIKSNTNIVNQMLLSMVASKILPLTNWDNEFGYSYGNSYLFIHFLSQAGRYQNTSKGIIKALVQSGFTGENSVENVTGEPFEKTLAKFGLSLFINDWNNPDPQAYGINGINLKGTYLGIKLPGYEIEDIDDNTVYIEGNYLPMIMMNNLRKNTIRCFKKKANNQGKSSIIYSGDSPVSIYFFDERE